MRNLSILRFCFLLILAASLTACVNQTPAPSAVNLEASPTPPPLPTETATSTSTPEPTPTPRPTNTPIPTAVPTLALGDVQTLASGGFSFQPILGYEFQVAENQLIAGNPSHKVVLSLMGQTANDSAQSGEEILDGFLDALARKGNGEFTKGEEKKITVGGVEGIAFDLTGNLGGVPLVGEAMLVMPSERQYLFGLATAFTDLDPDLWESEGSRAFRALLGSVQFLEVSAEGGACAVSDDPTYGYTPENPIRVGGDWLDGPARERAYLDVLRGPGGEALTYERSGSQGFEDTILDLYRVDYHGAASALTLYVDEYTYVELKAPKGLTCASPIPLSAP